MARRRLSTPPHLPSLQSHANQPPSKPSALVRPNHSLTRTLPCHRPRPANRTMTMVQYMRPPREIPTGDLGVPESVSPPRTLPTPTEASFSFEKIKLTRGRVAREGSQRRRRCSRPVRHPPLPNPSENPRCLPLFPLLRPRF